MKTPIPTPTVSQRWQQAAGTSKYTGDLPALRSFVHAEAKSAGSRLMAITSRSGLLEEHRAALCAAVWLLLDYHGTSTKYRLLEKQRVELYRFLRDLAEQMDDKEVQYLVTRLVEQPPQSRRFIRHGSIAPASRQHAE